MSDVIPCQGSKICSPFVPLDALDATIFYVSAGTGEIFAYDPAAKTHTSHVYSGGEPYGAQFDGNGRLHIADCAHAAVLRTDDALQPGVMVKAYEERSFRGPSSIAFGDGILYFTDSGPLGETTIEKPHGSVFCIGLSPSGGQILRPLALECLAHPCGLAVCPTDPKIVYLAETMQNRILRLSQRPTNTYHLSVFYQFSGGMGPSCIACDSNGLLYVGHYDFAGTT